MRIITAFALAMLGALLFTGCTRNARSMDPRQIEQQYGAAGAYSNTIALSDWPLQGTLANGREGSLFIPQKQTNDLHTVYLRDEQGLHPVRLGDKRGRNEMVLAPAIVDTRPASHHATKRS